MNFEWPYYTLRNGILFREEISDNGRGGKVARKLYRSFPKAPQFQSVAEAEAWLEAQDERGNVREG